LVRHLTCRPHFCKGLLNAYNLRSLENQLNSTWNSYNALAINWCLNWSTDLLCAYCPSAFIWGKQLTLAVFILPFFVINCLKLRKRQKIALCGVFSLGLLTIGVSLARFVVYTATAYTIDDAGGSKSIAPSPFHYSSHAQIDNILHYEDLISNIA
jgi:hypothetical protein